MPKKPKPDRDVVGPPAAGGHAEAKDDEAARKRAAAAAHFSKEGRETSG